MLRVLIRASGVVFLLLATSLFSWAGQKNQGELRVFASISLTESLTEIAAQYEKDTHQKIRLNFAGSNLIAEQIQMGVPADLFLSADAKWIDDLQGKGFIRKETRLDLLSSCLVLIVNKESPLVIKRIEDLLQPKVGRIALGDGSKVASGSYSRDYLERKKLWAPLEPRFVITSNARATLSAVEADRVGVGFVYKADAMISHGIRVAYEIPESEIPPIHFFASVTTHSAHATEAQALLDYLSQPESLTVFKRYGFAIVKLTPTK